MPAPAVVGADQRPQSPTPPAGMTQQSGDQSVLIVDDEPSLRSIQKRFLAKSGVRVTLASSGAEAKAMISRERFDAIVTDIRMPGELDGIALYHWIKTAKPELAERCLFVSGDLADTLRESLLKELPERLIAKPFTRDDYVARVHAVLGLGG
jgi:two-component system NtrC family sensor kinase